MRTPVLPLSWWKRTVLRETAEDSFTGTVTRPKEMAPVQIERGTGSVSPMACAAQAAHGRFHGSVWALPGPARCERAPGARDSVWRYGTPARRDYAASRSPTT